MHSQIIGCTDPLSKNFNSSATVNDGSCTYRSAKVRVKYSIQLPATLHETSGLVLNDNLFWTTNDDTDTTIYGVDTTGVIQKKVLKSGQQRLGGDFTRQHFFYIEISAIMFPETEKTSIF
jgi:hypothetical protein